jgi:dihydroflavonol-4-reductase
VQVDITNPDSLRGVFDGVQVLYNLAGRISLRKGDEALVNAVNVGGVANIIDAVAASDVERMVHFSSIHAFEHNPPERVISEAVPLVERDAPSYSVSKARAAARRSSNRARGDRRGDHPPGRVYRAVRL